MSSICSHLPAFQLILIQYSFKKGCTVVLMNIKFSLRYYINAHLVKYIHTLINGNRNPQGGMLA
jgi:hypothetical protein